jgi:hypothetical protein
VPEVAGVGHQIAQQIGCGQRVLRRRRHLHGVDVEVDWVIVGSMTDVSVLVGVGIIVRVRVVVDASAVPISGMAEGVGVEV